MRHFLDFLSMPKKTGFLNARRQRRRPQDSLRERLGPCAETHSRRLRQAKAWRGVYGVCALCRRPCPVRSKIVLFLTCSKNPKNVAELPPRGSPNGARNLKNHKKMHSGCLLKSKLGKTPQLVRILTPSNPLKRAKTNTKTPCSGFHPDTKQSQK